ncbi:TRAP transporter small permease [bacterium]|nr:TRAP transporter small permease [bacterium]
MSPERPAPRPLSIVHRAEDYFLALLLTAMIVLAVLQIVLRNGFDTGLSWIDPLLRTLVLWVGLLGAVVATRQDRHIAIDLVSKFFAPRRAAVVRIGTDIFTCVVSALVAYAGVRFVRDEMEVGNTTFADIPVWITEIVIPFAFGVIAIRYARFAVIHVVEAVRGAPPDVAEPDRPGEAGA